MKLPVPKGPDRRINRTRRQLGEAIVTLILERGWEQVSVRDICAHADVGRSTFYVHFADKEELLLSGLEDLHAMLDEVRRTNVGSFAFADALVAHVKDARRLFQAVVGRKSGQQVVRRFRDVVVRLVQAELEALGLPREVRSDLAPYISGGFVELLIAWLEGPASADADALASTFRTLTRGLLSSVSGRARTART